MTEVPPTPDGIRFWSAIEGTSVSAGSREFFRYADIGDITAMHGHRTLLRCTLLGVLCHTLLQQDCSTMAIIRSRRCEARRDQRVMEMAMNQTITRALRPNYFAGSSTRKSTLRNKRLLQAPSTCEHSRGCNVVSDRRS